MIPCLGTREMAQQLGALFALAEAPGLAPITRMAKLQLSLTPVPWNPPILSSGFLGTKHKNDAYTYRQVKTHKIKIFKSSGKKLLLISITV